MIKILLSKQSITEIEVDLLVLVVDSTQSRSNFGKLNTLLDGELRALAEAEEFEGKFKQTLSLPSLGKVPSRRLLLFGLSGEKEPKTKADWIRFGGMIMRRAKDYKPKTMALVLPGPLDELEERTLGLALGLNLAHYSFDKYKSKAKDWDVECTIVLPKRTTKSSFNSIQGNVHRELALATGVVQARDLVNEPASVLTPKEFASRAKKMAEASGLECHILTEKEMKKLGMGMFLAVASGSAQKPRLIHLIYKPKQPIRKTKPKIALVGKGITFDSGGLSLKGPTHMLNMHGDMAGAAAVFGAMQVIAALKPIIEVHGFLAAAENMTGGAAYKLNDILHALNGKTVEVHNTDAEGRLVLGDTLAYACQQKVDEVIDVATLTGACVVALGDTTAGIMGNDQKMIDLLIASGAQYAEPLWQLPLIEELRPKLDSDVADLKNIGGRYGGAITAGLFLREFVESKVKWAHIDIAGPSGSSKDKDHISQGGTGFAVATLVQFVLERAKV